jgi:uncharacterized protein (UPF0218 family)
MPSISIPDMPPILKNNIGTCSTLRVNVEGEEDIAHFPNIELAKEDTVIDPKASNKVQQRLQFLLCRR